MTSPSNNARDELARSEARAAQIVQLESTFVETPTFVAFRKRIFDVLAEREANLKHGVVQQKGACIIGAAGSGKTRMVVEVVRQHTELMAEAGGRQFGHRIVSTVVPGRGTVKETCTEILRALDYPIKSARDDDYLFQLIPQQMKARGIAALCLDEIQDVGRHKTTDTVEHFIKRFRNLMQHSEWPVCLIVSGTPETKAMINHDPTLTRRLRPIEMEASTYEKEGVLIRKTIEGFLAQMEISDAGLLAEPDMISCLIHAGASCFGLTIEIAIAAITDALSQGHHVLTIEHFADAYYERSNSDDELNPFVASNWRMIDTRKAMDRWIEAKPNRKAR